MKEYRVLNKSKRGIFALCATKESAVRFIDSLSPKDNHFDVATDNIVIQSRPKDMQGDDSTWSDEV